MFEASELAEVLGTQLGLSSSLGISFEETSAFIATYTKTTGDARAASTSFGGVMMALAKTTPKMEKALNKVGMTGDSVREMLGDQGLKATLEHLKSAFEESNIPLTDFFSKSQALKGVLGVLGNQTETYGQILEDMGDSAGLVAGGFETFSSTTGFKMQQAFTNLKNAAMELGAVMMPVFTAIVNGAVKLGNAFTELDGGTKKMLVGAAALVAFSGPLMTLAGGLVSVLGMVLSPIGLIVVGLGALFYVIYNNWGTVKGYLVSFINYFIDLYNESTIFRFAVEGVTLAFKILWINAKLTFQNIWVTLKALASNITDTFGGVADVMGGAMKRGAAGYAQMAIGMTKVSKGVKGTLGDAVDGLEENYTKAGQEAIRAFQDGAEAMITKKKIKFITEDDIQGGVDDVQNWLTDKLGKVKDKLKGFMGGSSLLVPESTSTTTTTTETKTDGPGALEGNLDKKLSVWQQYWLDVKSGSKSLVGTITEGWNAISQVASSVLTGIGNLYAAENDKAMTIMEQEQTVAQENFDADYQREQLALENSILTKAERGEAETALKLKYDGKQNTIDEKFEEKKKSLRMKAARQEKSMKIASAIMSTAQAVVNALGSVAPPANFILAGIVGGLGAAQIAAISSTPLPMASGGLAFGPVNAIVGDNPGAHNDPEVVAPLSKLRSMLGGEMNVALNVGGIIKGNDIYLTNESTTEQRPRYI
tara:strand:- start:8172 stop:10289 length:2118 start_codon:yes stop_codon:yes gene_type:complete